MTACERAPSGETPSTTVIDGTEFGLKQTQPVTTDHVLTLEERVARASSAVEDPKRLVEAAGGNIEMLSAALDAIAAAGGVAADCPAGMLAGFVAQWYRSAQPDAFYRSVFQPVDQVNGRARALLM